jgi:hypothetical protein
MLRRKALQIHHLSELVIGDVGGEFTVLVYAAVVHAGGARDVTHTAILCVRELLDSPATGCEGVEFIVELERHFWNIEESSRCRMK